MKRRCLLGSLGSPRDPPPDAADVTSTVVPHEQVAWQSKPEFQLFLGAAGISNLKPVGSPKVLDFKCTFMCHVIMAIASRVSTFYP